MGAGDERIERDGPSTCGNTGVERALGKLYALCAMYQDLDYFLRPIIEDLERCDGGPVRKTIYPDEGNRLPGDQVVGGEVVRRLTSKA